MYVILIGPPGCGKGTQSKKLTAHLSIPHLSTGEILRAAVRDQSEVGLRVVEAMRAGNLVSDDLILGLLGERLSDGRYQNGCLFDGVPRTVAQAQALDELLSRRDAAVNLALQLKVEEAELIRRMTQRGTLEGRADDSLETIRHRLRVYSSQTVPILEYYRHRGCLRTVDAQGTPDQVFQRILPYLPQP